MLLLPRWSHSFLTSIGQNSSSPNMEHMHQD